MWKLGRARRACALTSARWSTRRLRAAARATLAPGESYGTARRGPVAHLQVLRRRGDGLIDKVRRTVERPAKYVSVKISRRREDDPGRRRADRSASLLHRQIGAAMTSTSQPRTFVAETQHTQPKVTEAAPKRRTTPSSSSTAAKPAAAVQGREAPPDLRHRRRPGRVGEPGRPVTIANRAVIPSGVPNSARALMLAHGHRGDEPEQLIKARRLGINDGVGIHGTADHVIGSDAFHGGIRCTFRTSRSSTTRPAGAAV